MIFCYTKIKILKPFFLCIFKPLIEWIKSCNLRFSCTKITIADLRYFPEYTINLLFFLGLQWRYLLYLNWTKSWTNEPISINRPLFQPIKLPGTIMVLILDGNSLRGAHVRRNICYSTCSRHLITSRAVTNRVFLPEKTHFPSCVRNM